MRAEKRGHSGKVLPGPFLPVRANRKGAERGRGKSLWPCGCCPVSLSLSSSRGGSCTNCSPAPGTRVHSSVPHGSSSLRVGGNSLSPLGTELPSGAGVGAVLCRVGSCQDKDLAVCHQWVTGGCFGVTPLSPAECRQQSQESKTGEGL